MDLSIFRAEGVAVLRGVAAAGPYIRLRGSGFAETTGVYVNGVLCPEWIVLSDTLISARVPEAVRKAVIDSIEVRVPAASGQPVVLVQELQDTPTSGPGQVAQTFLKLLLTSQGSDIFSPEVGGNIGALIGGNIDAAGLRLAISQAIDRVSVALQREATTRPRTERFATAQLIGCDAADGRAEIRLRILTLAGEAALVGVEL